MILPKVEEKHTYNSSIVYKFTNEAPEEYIKLLGERTFQRGAGICSGGEVPLFVLMPRCDEVIAIDHSLGSLAAAYIKVVMLGHLGPKGMLNALTGSHKSFMAEACNA